MNKLLTRVIGISALLLFFYVSQAGAQEGVSEKDKKALRAIFKDVPSDQYKLSFDGGKEVYGTKKIEMSDLRRTAKTSDRSTLAAFTFLAADRSENEVIYIYSEGLDVVESMLGKRKFTQLQAIMEKYEPQMRR